MKKLIYVLVVLLLVILSSCANKDTIELQKKESVDSIELQIEKVHNAFLVMKESNPNAVLQLSMNGEELVSKIEVLQEEQYDVIRSFGNSEPLCKGDGISFVRCAKKQLDKLGCIVIKTCAYCAYPC